MQANLVKLAAQPREVLGKKVSTLRRSGWTPANIFGPGTPSVPVQLVTKDVERMLAHVSRTSLIALDVEGTEPVTVLVRGVARRPTNDELFHIDFYRVSMTHTLKASVPILLAGEAPAVKQHEATILREMDTLNVECLPGDLPQAIEVMIDGLAELGDAIHVRDLVLPDRVTVLEDPDAVVVHAIAPQRMEADEVEEAEEAAAEEVAEGAAAEAPEGEAPKAEA